MVRVLSFGWKNRGLLALLSAFLVVLPGCGGKVVSFTTPHDNGGCQQLWEGLEEAIQTRQVADNTAVRIQGFPYLRSTRYLQGLSAMAVSTEEQLYVLEEMRLLDLEKRSLELSRIQEDIFGKVRVPALLDKQISACSQQFLAADTKSIDFFAQVRSAIELDRDYSLWLRSVGLYPVTSLVVGLIAANAQEEMVARLSKPVGQEELAKSLTFRPPQPLAESVTNLPQILRRSRTTSLLALNIADQDLLALAHKFAPLLTIANGAEQDRFGRIVRKQESFEVDGEDPVVYYYFSQTFVQHIPALQINYVIWFAERTAPAPWFEQGALDGILFRVTLNWQGQPIFVDSALQCGCYHFVLFNEKLVSARLPGGKGFMPTVAGPLPELEEGDRLQFTMEAGWHQISHVGRALPAVSQPRYQLLPYQDLEYFSHDNKVISLFDNRGRVAGTNRLERFFLFPMGIPKVGTMRQRGRQPITLIGRAYFDDPYLFDNAFSYHPPLPAVSELTWSAMAAQQQATPKQGGEAMVIRADKAEEGSQR